MRRRKQKQEQHTDESWLLPYSDMLTLLVALFIVLFAMSEIDAQKYEDLSQVFKSEFSGGDSFLEESSSGKNQPETTLDDPEEDEEKEENGKVSNSTQELMDLQELQAKINNYIETNNLAEALGTKLTDEGLLITILNHVSFDPGSAVVKSEGKEIAEEVSSFLHTEPPHQIVISGHADDRPMHNEEFASNWELSVIRAVNFMGLILNNEKHDPTRFSAKGFGEHQPIVPNTSEENRAKNRRVEILILPNFEINTNED